MAASGAPLIPVPSGAEVWLQEELTDRVPGVGPVQRFRFVMPDLSGLVPPPSEDGMAEGLDPDLLDEPFAGDLPLTPEEQAELDDAGGDLLIAPVPQADPGAGASLAPMPEDLGGLEDAPLPEELAAPDAALPEGAETGSDADRNGGRGMGAEEMALPAAPDILMQDPLHRDIVWLCETYALPRLAGQVPRPAQVVISMASAPSPFGSFDPGIVQIFEGFSIPPDRDACLWEPL